MKFFRTLILFVFFLLVSCTNFTPILYAQREANNWYFGEGAGIIFDYNNIATGTGGLMHTDEGCSSISSANGDLLFYTDGSMIWDKNHLLMPNSIGLMGLSSSTQSALIIRQPGSDHIYYVFTADGNSTPLNHHLENGYRYSIVDMYLNGGSGAVTPTKNVLLYAPSTEKLCAVKHADGVNMWIMTHEFNSNRFRAYLLSCDGLDTNAVLSDEGLAHNIVNNGGPVSYRDAVGQMKFSPDGKRLALVINGQNRVQVFNFDASTGHVNNPVSILSYFSDGYTQPGGGGMDFEFAYGVEFSPNGNMLYISRIEYGDVYQYDLTPGTSTGISATGRKMGIGPWCTLLPNLWWSCTGTSAALQLAPDGKIYQSNKPANGINVIADPDLGPGAFLERSCQFSGHSAWGLPSFAASYFNPYAIITQAACYELTFSTGYSEYITAAWDFGDPSTTQDQALGAQVTYTYPQPGEYEVTLALTNSGGCSDTIRKNITVNCIDLLYPNVLTSNGDGLNDGLTFEGLDDYPENEVVIYNRWGTEIFHKKDYKNTEPFTGQNISEGVYFYIVRIPKYNYQSSHFFTLFK